MYTAKLINSTLIFYFLNFISWCIVIITLVVLSVVQTTRSRHACVSGEIYCKYEIMCSGKERDESNFYSKKLTPRDVSPWAHS